MYGLGRVPPGDGWAGTQPASGSVQIGNATGGTVNYSINCLTGNQIGIGNVAVTWDYIAPLTNLSGPSGAPLMLGATTGLNWEANVGPCVATGGVAGDGWAGPQPISGSLSITVTQTGIAKYTLSCGTGARAATDSVLVDGVAPQITLVAQVSAIRVGSSFQLNWFGNGIGGACSASGGSSTDGWALNNANVVSNGSTQVTENVAGTYTYTLTCTGGGQSASSSVMVVITNDPPAISLSATAPEQEIYPIGVSFTPSLDLVWTSNISGCSIEYTSNGTSGGPGVQILSAGNPAGAVSDIETTPGLVTYTLRCGGTPPLTASTTINWIATKSTLNSIATPDPNWAANVAYPISWNAGSGPCVGSGGVPGDNWAGPKATTGTQSVSESSPGTYVVSLTCGSGGGAQTSQLAVTVPPPFIQVYSASLPTSKAPYPVPSIAWHSTVGPCTYLDGSAANAMEVSVPPTGTATPSPATSGTYLFSVSCGSGANLVYAATLAQFTVYAPTTLTASANSAPVDGPVTLTWTAADSAICIATGGDGTAPWAGTLGGAGSGSLIVTSSSVGSVTYGINCNGLTAQTAVAYQAVPATSVSVPTPQVTLSANESTQTEGQSISLTWNSKNADSCSASGGLAGDGWSGNLASSGTATVSETQAGTMNYAITCTGAPPAATASVTVVIKSAPVANTSSGHSGGGKIDGLLLLALSMFVIARVSAHRTDRRAFS